MSLASLESANNTNELLQGQIIVGPVGTGLFPDVMGGVIGVLTLNVNISPCGLHNAVTVASIIIYWLLSAGDVLTGLDTTLKHGLLPLFTVDVVPRS
jgi:hypothetical protein